MKFRPGLGTGIAVAGGIALLALAFMWITPQMQLKLGRWTPPAAQDVRVAELLDQIQLPARVPALTAADIQKNMERHLFRMSRSAVRPQPVAAAPVQRDIWTDARVLGIFQGAVSGAIVHLDGKPQRILVGESLGGWLLKDVSPAHIGIEKEGQQRSVHVPKPNGSPIQLPTAPAMELVIGTRPK